MMIPTIPKNKMPPIVIVSVDSEKAVKYLLKNTYNHRDLKLLLILCVQGRGLHY